MDDAEDGSSRVCGCLARSAALSTETDSGRGSLLEPGAIEVTLFTFGPLPCGVGAG